MTGHAGADEYALPRTDGHDGYAGGGEPVAETGQERGEAGRGGAVTEFAARPHSPATELTPTSTPLPPFWKRSAGAP